MIRNYFLKEEIDNHGRIRGHLARNEVSHFAESIHNNKYRVPAMQAPRKTCYKVHKNINPGSFSNRPWSLGPCISSWSFSFLTDNTSLHKSCNIMVNRRPIKSCTNWDNSFVDAEMTSIMNLLYDQSTKRIWPFMPFHDLNLMVAAPNVNRRENWSSRNFVKHII